MKLTVDYGGESRLDKAIDAIEEVLAEFQHQLEKVEIVPADSTVFRISLDSEIIFDLDEEGYSVEEIKKRLEDRIKAN